MKELRILWDKSVDKVQRIKHINVGSYPKQGSTKSSKFVVAPLTFLHARNFFYTENIETNYKEKPELKISKLKTLRIERGRQ